MLLILIYIEHTQNSILDDALTISLCLDIVQQLRVTAFHQEMIQLMHVPNQQHITVSGT